MLKEIWNSKKNIIIAVGALLLVGTLAASGTVAYYNSKTDPLTNTFTIGNVETKIEEEFENGIKNPKIVNTGKSDCLVRMRYIISPSNAETNNGVKLTGFDVLWGDKQADDFFYYSQVLKSGESTESLFSRYELNEGLTKQTFVPFEIIVYQEAVQAEAVIEGVDHKAFNIVDGQKVYNKEEAEKIWNAYDQGLLVQAAETTE